MASRELTYDQADKINAKLGPMLVYLNRLHQRMVETGFPPDDRLRELTFEARNAIQHLTMAIHYASRKGQTGGRERRAPTDGQ